MFSHLHKLSLMPPSNARSYLLASVKNIASSMISEDPSSQCSIISLSELTEDAVPDRTDLLNEICTSEASRQLVQTILSLPEDTQGVLYLYFVEFMNLREISARLQLPYSTICKRFRRGKQQLRKKIRRIGDVLIYETK